MVVVHLQKHSGEGVNKCEQVDSMYDTTLN